MDTRLARLRVSVPLLGGLLLLSSPVCVQAQVEMNSAINIKRSVFTGGTGAEGILYDSDRFEQPGGVVILPDFPSDVVAIGFWMKKQPISEGDTVFGTMSGDFFLSYERSDPTATYEDGDLFSVGLVRDRIIHNFGGEAYVPVRANYRGIKNTWENKNPTITPTTGGMSLGPNGGAWCNWFLDIEDSWLEGYPVKVEHLKITPPTLYQWNGKSTANLVTNPGNETSGGGGYGSANPFNGHDTGDDVYGWCEKEDPGGAEKAYRGWCDGNDVEPRSGDSLFSIDDGGSELMGECYQEIDVSAYATHIDAGQQTFDVGGFVKTYPDGYDTGQIIVEYRDGPNGEILAIDESEELSPVTEWEKINLRRVIPPDTRRIRIRLISRRTNAENSNDIDAAFDDIFLEAEDRIFDKDVGYKYTIHLEANDGGAWVSRDVTINVGREGDPSITHQSEEVFGEFRNRDDAAPLDNDWHYYVYVFTGAAGGHAMYRYVDGQLDVTATGKPQLFSIGSGVGWIESFYVDSGVEGGEPMPYQPALKMLSPYDLIVDDISVWDGSSLDVATFVSYMESIHTGIYKYGAEQGEGMPAEGHPHLEYLKQHYTCSSAQTAPSYYQDDTFNMSWNTVFAKKAPPSVQTLDDPLRKYTRVISTSRFLGATDPIGNGDGEDLDGKTYDLNFDLDYDYGDDFVLEAPEFVYLDSNAALMDDPSEEEIEDDAFYRAKCLGYTVNGGELQNSVFVFRRTLDKNVSIEWQWEVEYAVVINSATAAFEDLEESLGNAEPRVGKHWIKHNTLLSPEIDGIILNMDTQGQGFRFTTLGYSISFAGGATTTIDWEAVPRVAIPEFAVTDYVEIEWRWQREYTLKVNVNETMFNSTPYIRTAADGLVLNRDGVVWVTHGDSVTVGAEHFATVDKVEYSLKNIHGQTGAFEEIGIEDTTDPNTGTDPPLREFNIPSIEGPGELTWYYEGAVYRAMVLIGEGVDVSTETRANQVLTPNLPGTAELKTDTEPELVSYATRDAEGSSAADKYVVWDAVRKMVLPVRPGQYYVRFGDKNDPELHYTLEIIAGMPTNEDVVTWDRPVDAYGHLVGDSPTIVWGDLPDSYPASPEAHYNYLFSGDGPRQPPISLDPNPADRWVFHGQTYTTCEGVVQTETNTFAAAKRGRSVLLYGFRPEANEVANGDASKEGYVVRIVETLDMDGRTQADTMLSASDREQASFTGGANTILTMDTDLAIGRDADHTIEFWAKLEEAAESGKDRILFEQTLTDGRRLQLGFHAYDNPVSPDGFFVRTSLNGKTCYAADGIGDSQQDRWTHWAIVFHNGAAQPKVYRNGMLYLPASAGIVSLDQPTQSVKIEGDRTGVFMAGKRITITGSTGNDGTYDISASTYDEGEDTTEITLNENLPDNTPDGSVVAEVWPNYSTATVAGVDTYLAGTKERQQHVGFSGKLDNLRVWDAALSTDDVRLINFGRTPGSGSLDLELTFDGDDDDSGLLQTVTQAVQVDDVLETSLADGPMEVAQRIFSKLDTAGLGTGYLLNEITNYNAFLYDRNAEPVGTWGPIFPVNWSGLYTANDRRLETAYYENPYKDFSDSDTVIHPNVNWPYCVVNYTSVDYPTQGPKKDNRVYLASRIGSEGVTATGEQQLIYEPGVYEELTIYNQPDRDKPGFNPNEEHAIVADSIRAQLIGGPSPNVPAGAAFALQNELNITSRGSSYTSDPWVLVYYKIVETGEWDMNIYKVERIRIVDNDSDGDADPDTIFPQLDSETHLPTDRFGRQVEQPDDPSYVFDYATFAGDPLIPPYPLNLVSGAVALPQCEGGNIVQDSVYRRSLWKDKNGNGWIVAGDGRFFQKYWYPLRSDFWFEVAGKQLNVSTPVVWVSVNGKYLDNEGAEGDPKKILYRSYWRTDYPVLKRGETLTYAGGEYKAEHAAHQGLPAIVAMKSAQIVYDSQTPDMCLVPANVNAYSARVIRPLDRIEYSVPLKKMPESLTPAYTDNCMVVRERWYFKQLVGSLQKRLYYDSLRSKLVFRGRLNELESGDSDLTETPVALYTLQPNIMTKEEFDQIRALGDDQNSSEWTTAIREIFQEAQNPQHADVTDFAMPNPNLIDPVFYAGLDDAPEPPAEGEESDVTIQPDFFSYDDSSDDYLLDDGAPERDYQHLDSFGVGSALIPNPAFLPLSISGELYVTVAENNHEDATGAISLHIIELGDDRFRGAVKVIEPQDVFDEKINLQHTAEFAANTADVYYQWWVREAAPLDDVGMPGVDDKWQVYDQGLGKHKIAFQGRPDIVLADQLFYVRYGEKGEFEDLGDDPGAGSVADDNWRLVAFESDTFNKFSAGSDLVPFQWAGASNSPQLQADGSKKYIPQLVMGWVKRVLDRVNPYEARFSDFLNNDSAAVYSSMMQIAGGPFIGKVALNSDKDVIENVGLIELYETVLLRAKELTIQIPGAATYGTNQALLLAATRLAELYNLLGAEAYIDAQNPSIALGEEPTNDDQALTSAATYVHAFMNQEASVLHEELALLRGTDFLKAYPAYNRLMWNYVKGLGEAAYNSNYGIYDENEDGFINEYDAANLYPQGHGDAWGHLVSAAKMHYELLRHNAFLWYSRSELYSLLDNVIEADYLDEKSFARIAAMKARAGREIVEGTYCLAYCEDPDGQWQGYTDTDPARAWGVSEWSKRVGQAALFDWVVGNALVPVDVDETFDMEKENLDEIDRTTNQAEIAEIAANYLAVQNTLDAANAGMNPIGQDPDSIVFDVSPNGYGEGVSHFEQVYERAASASDNAVRALTYAGKAENRLRKVAEATEELQMAALEQDLDYRNRLIEIFGRPYDGMIGAGKPYPEGYLGPDVLLYLYVDRIETDGLIPGAAKRYVEVSADCLKFASDYRDVSFGDHVSGETIESILSEYYLLEGEAGELGGLDSMHATLNIPVIEASDYAFQAEEDWGARIAYGRVHTILGELLAQEIEYQAAINEYDSYVVNLELAWQAFIDLMEIKKVKNEILDEATEELERLRKRVADAKSAALGLHQAGNTLNEVAKAVAEFLPKVVGFSNDVTSGGRGGVMVGLIAAGEVLHIAGTASDIVAIKTEEQLANVADVFETEVVQVEDLAEFKGRVAQLSTLMSDEYGLRLGIAKKLQAMRMTTSRLQTTLAEGFRLMSEREAYNKELASKAQKNRYQDMALRLTRNDALNKYRDAFRNAQRYAWLAAKAYDYEASLEPGDPAAAQTLLEEVVRTRSLGLWDGDEPRVGKGGLGAILAQLKANFDTLEGQFGINNPQEEVGCLSFRSEYFRIAPDSDGRWENALQRRRVENLWDLGEFRQFCRPFAADSGVAEPALVISFGTEITSRKNAFGRSLGSQDHAFSSANFATKILSAGVRFNNYEAAGLSTTPRVYLIPAGQDVLRIANSGAPKQRTWNVVEQVIPIPFIINDSNLTNPSYIPSIDSLNGAFAQIKRFGDFRAYPDNVPEDGPYMDSRLVARSVWNTRWLLIIPGASLHADPEYGLNQFVEHVDDIKLVLRTYAHSGI